MKEEWREVYHGYEVSNKGRVRSYRPLNGRGDLVKVPRILQYRLVCGYPTVNVYGHYTGKIHILVLEAFDRLRPKGMQARHLDGNRENNYITNLKWGTSKENGKDKAKHGRAKNNKNSAKLSVKDVKEIKRLLAETNYTFRKISSMFGVNSGTIQNIANGNSWSDIEYDKPFKKRKSGSSENNSHAKLTTEKVKEIRLLLQTEKYNNFFLANKYGVSPETISMIKTGRIWKDIKI